MNDKPCDDQEIDLKQNSRRLIHDIRTQLFCMEISAKSIQVYMPRLIQAFVGKSEQSTQSEALEIPDEHLDILKSAATDIKQNLDLINRSLEKFLLELEPSRSSEMLHSTYKAASQEVNKDASLKILLVEDEVIHQDITRKVLSSVNCAIDVASDGWDAFEKFQSHRYDIVLMDLHLPHLSGMEATVKMRELEDTDNQTPIIGMSNIEPFDRDAFFACGFNKFLLKPLKLDTFRDTLRQLYPHWET